MSYSPGGSAALPEDLELMAPDARLCARLAAVDRRSLSDRDRVRLLPAPPPVQA